MARKSPLEALTDVIKGADGTNWGETTKETYREVKEAINNGTDYIGIVIAREGAPLTEGDIAGRIGGFHDVEQLEASGATDEELIATILRTKNNIHNNYQDSQAFLDNGGNVGMQHDPLLYGAYLINPASFIVQKVPMLVVEQGEVAVIKSYVGGKEKDESGDSFKFGTLVKPGRRGIWQTPLRTGKYAINPKCYEAVMVKTSIINLNWADAISSAHNLDARLGSITAKSKEGFELKIDLQVQIHIPDTQAPKVISSVGTMENLVDDILQAAVGNHFRDSLQSMSAVSFIENRQQIQVEAYEHIQKKLISYGVETVGVYIQDVVYPEELVKVLKEREIAVQQRTTYIEQEKSQKQRIAMEATKGEADKQSALAASQVDIKIAENNAKSNIEKAAGDAKYKIEVGYAEANVTKAKQLAEASGYLAKVESLGAEQTALIEIIRALAESQKGIKLLPETLISGGGDGLSSMLTKFLVDITKGGSSSPINAEAIKAKLAALEAPLEPDVKPVNPPAKEVYEIVKSPLMTSDLTKEELENSEKY